MRSLLVPILVIVMIAPSCYCIRCYECSSDQVDKMKGGAPDNCGAYDSFDTNRNTPVDCAGEEANVPGTFCYKSIQQGPRGFIWDGRWRTVERRCAQVSDRGISWGCDWGYDDNGVYWEKCYCAEDGCNSSHHLMSSPALFLGLMVMVTSWFIMF